MGHGGGVGGGEQIELGLHLSAHDEASETLGGLKEHLKGLGEGLLDIGKIAGGFALGGLFQQLGAGLGGAIEEGLGSMKDLGAATLEMTRQTGLSAENASGLLAVFGRFGVSSDQASTSLGIFSKHLAGIADVGDALLPISKSFTTQIAALGLTMKDASGQALPMNDILLQVADKFAAMPDGVDKTALSMALFGKSGKDLIPILDLGKAGMQEAMDTAAKYGLTLTGDNLNAIKDFGLAQKDLTEAGEGLKLQIGVALLPILVTLTKTAVTLAQSFNTLVMPAIKSFGTAIIAVVKPPLDWFAGALGTVGTIIGQFLAYLDPANKTDVMRAWFGPDFGPKIDEVVRGIKGVVTAIGQFVADIGGLLGGQKSLGDVLGDFLAIGGAEGNLLGKLAALGGQIVTTLIGAAGDLGGKLTAWLAAQWALIDWGKVWATVQGVAFNVGRFLGNVGQQVTAFLAAQWALIDWAKIWATVQTTAFDVGRFLGHVGVQVTAFLVGEWATIDWTKIWAGAQGIGAGLVAAFGQIDLGPIATSIGSAVSDAVGKIDWPNVLAAGLAFSALVQGWTRGVGNLDWSAVGELVAAGIVEAITLPFRAAAFFVDLISTIVQGIASSVRGASTGEVSGAAIDWLQVALEPFKIVNALMQTFEKIALGIASGIAHYLGLPDVLGKLEAAGAALMQAIADGIRSIQLPVFSISTTNQTVLGQTIGVPSFNVRAQQLGGGGARGQSVVLNFTQAAPIYGHANHADAVLAALVTLQRAGALKVALV